MSSRPTTHPRSIAILVCCACCLAVSSPVLAAPEGAIVVLQFQQTAERRVVMGASDRGMVFLGEDLGNFRAFRSRAIGTSRQFLWVEDIDNDRDVEYVFAGNPSFVLDGGGDPLFGMLDGCDDFEVGNIAGDPMAEIFCRHGSTMSVWSYDGQFLWEYAVTGMDIGSCTGDDVDGDDRLEFGCSAGDVWLLVDIENEESVQEVPDNPAESGHSDPFAAWASDAEAALSGGEQFDIDGDGNAEETLSWNSGTLTLMSGSGATLGSASIGESALYSVAVGDLNGDGTPEVFVGGVGRIYVVSASGDLVGTVEANPGSLDREARVTLQSAAANGLAESTEDVVRGQVQEGMGAVERCYRTRMGTDQFVRVGTMLYELQVDGSGRVSSSQRIHSSVNNRQLESCVSGALEDLRFSGATDGSGTVTVRLGFDFVDR